jgi:hypothetical protein
LKPAPTCGGARVKSQFAQHRSPEAGLRRMRRPSSAAGMLKKGEACAAPQKTPCVFWGPYEGREPCVGATHASPFIHRRHAERGRGMRRPSSAAGMLKEGEACGVPKNAMRFLGTPTRPYERREPCVGATHASPIIRRRHAERGRGMRRPSSTAGMLKKGEACLAPTNGEPCVGATHASPSGRRRRFWRQGRGKRGHPNSPLRKRKTASSRPGNRNDGVVDGAPGCRKSSSGLQASSQRKTAVHQGRRQGAAVLKNRAGRRKLRPKDSGKSVPAEDDRWRKLCDREQR